MEIQIPRNKYFASNDIIDDRYKVVSLLGIGGMGEVYKVYDFHNENKIVALKITPGTAKIDDTNARRFQREIALMSKLSHSNIMAIYESGKVGNRLYYTMEFIQGKVFHGNIWQNLTIEEGLHIFIKIIEAIHVAHQANIVHRDLKPHNILLTVKKDFQKNNQFANKIEYLRPVIVDFGIAKTVESQSGITKAGTILGTLKYASPEQVVSQKVDHRSDVFSIGVMLYEFLTGTLPFARDTHQKTLVALLQEDPKPVRKHNKKITRDLANICMTAIQKKESNRYQTSKEFGADLSLYLDGKKPVLNPNVQYHSPNKLLIVGVVVWLVTTLLTLYIVFG
ncbi:serine/threonine-protein kinase [Candidatus Uabimicrobium sp. HlEnr_7]|uniref:serine/threonine-protein kinase n=1 Tax=Candidatus Uabimicrobium helgolandensis TaxID=3095367 RepID=UPI0035564A95